MTYPDSDLKYARLRSIGPVPGDAGLLPEGLDGDGPHEDVNGNGRADFADVVVFFNHL